MDTVKQCFAIILKENKEQSRQAARKVRKLLYSSARFDTDTYTVLKNLVHDAPEKYKKIADDWRQENFVVAVSVIYFLHDREARPDFLFPWLFQLLQHQSGVIRYAAVRMLSHELGPLTVHIRCPGHISAQFRKLEPEQADAILFALFMNLNEILVGVWKPSFKKYKHIDSLPVGPYKSTQMVLARLTELCGREYIDHFL